MKKDITELPPDVQAQIRALEVLPTTRSTRRTLRRFSTGPMPGAGSSTGL